MCLPMHTLPQLLFMTRQVVGDIISAHVRQTKKMTSAKEALEKECQKKVRDEDRIRKAQAHADETALAWKLVEERLPDELAAFFELRHEVFESSVEAMVKAYGVMSSETANKLATGAEMVGFDLNVVENDHQYQITTEEIFKELEDISIVVKRKA